MKERCKRILSRGDSLNPSELYYLSFLLIPLDLLLSGQKKTTTIPETTRFAQQKQKNEDNPQQQFDCPQAAAKPQGRF